MQPIEAETFTQPQTGKVHLVKVNVPEMKFFQCFCSFDRDFTPETQMVDLEDDNVCSTCANGWIRRHGEPEPSDTSANGDTDAQAATH